MKSTGISAMIKIVFFLMSYIALSYLKENLLKPFVQLCKYGRVSCYIEFNEFKWIQEGKLITL